MHFKPLIARKPFVGYGVGSYDPDHVRSPSMPYYCSIAAWTVLATVAASGLTNRFYESTAFGLAFVLTVVAFSRWR